MRKPGHRGGKADRIQVDWRSVIYRGIESEEIDYKAAQNWLKLGRAGKAKFARHCIALANTKGGYIVVGVGEDSAGRPRLFTGLTDADSKSFDPTIVGNFVNRFADPEVDFDIERPVVDGKRYAVFVVRRFDSLPHVCSNNCDNELRQGVFYIRTADATSRPAYRASEIHNLVQRALRNQREILGRMLRGILYEGRETLEPKAENLFKEETKNTRVLFGKKFPDFAERHALLEVSVCPSEYRRDKFGLTEIKQSVENSLFALSDSCFISSKDLSESFFTNVALRCLSHERRKLWQIFQSGHLCFFSLIEKKGGSIQYDDIFKPVAEALYFLGQFYTELGYAEELLTLHFNLGGTERVRLSLEGLPNGRRRPASDVYVCQIPEISTQMQRTVPDIASGHARHAEKVIRNICERFNMPDGLHNNLEKTIRKFLEKR